MPRFFKQRHLFMKLCLVVQLAGTAYLCTELTGQTLLTFLAFVFGYTSMGATIMHLFMVNKTTNH